MDNAEGRQIKRNSVNFILILMTLSLVLVLLYKRFSFRKALGQNKGYLSTEDS